MIFVEMETVKLSSIVEKLTPEMYPYLTQEELNSYIVLRDGLGVLQKQDALEIIQYSICEQQKDALIH
ncbi:hypothetical protein [Paenibacillus gansuensis]|uniref:Competence protein ComX n=1 Tax=Paenibacillus gansuensis TaxID=306542 RepID=A0ABW5PFE0_9BACL